MISPEVLFAHTKYSVTTDSVSVVPFWSLIKINR